MLTYLDYVQVTAPRQSLASQILFFYNRSKRPLAMMELTCPIDSVENLQSAIKNEDVQASTLI